MLPVQILHLLDSHARELLLRVPPVALLVVILHPEQHQRRHNQHTAARSEVEPVANVVVGRVRRQEAPRRDEAADVAHHDVEADGGAAGRVRHDVGADLAVADRAEAEERGGDEEGGAVAHAGVGRGQEHDVADHGHGRAGDEEDLAAVNLPRDEGQEEGEEAADDVGRDRVELLHDEGLARVDGADDGRGEEGEALDRDVVEQEDERGRQRYGRHHAQPQLLLVHVVEHDRLADALGADAALGHLALLGGQPAGRGGAVGEGQERDKSQAAGDDAFNDKDHAPRRDGADVVERQDGRGEQTAKGTGHGRHDDEEGQAEGELGAAVEAGEVVADSGEHAGLEHAEEEAHAGGLGKVVDKGRGQRDGAEAERDAGEPPSGAKVLAGDVGGDLKDDVRDVKDGEEGIVVVAGQAQVLFEAGDLGVACVPVLVVGDKTGPAAALDIPMLARSMKQKR